MIALNVTKGDNSLLKVAKNASYRNSRSVRNIQNPIITLCEKIKKLLVFILIHNILVLKRPNPILNLLKF